MPELQGLLQAAEKLRLRRNAFGAKSLKLLSTPQKRFFPEPAVEVRGDMDTATKPVPQGRNNL